MEKERKLFDFVIGNPPYQLESETSSTKNGQKPRRNIFQHFQLAADQISKKGSVMIYPGGRWIHQSGKGLQQFGKDLINDRSLSKLIYYPKSNDVFLKTDIPDGISIVVKNYQKKTDGFQYTYVSRGKSTSIKMQNPGDMLMPLNPSDNTIIQKINAFVKNNNLKFLHDGILPRSLFGIESDFVESNSGKVRQFKEGDSFDPNKEVKLYTNNKAGSAGRSMWFIVDKNTIKQNQKYISEWQVVVSSAHAGGQNGRDNQLSIIDNYSAFGRSRVALKSFKTLKEAQNFYKYMESNIIRYCLLITDESLTSLAKEVPDFFDYSDGQVLINFSKDIDKQLIDLMSLTSEEVAHIDYVIEKAWK